MIRSIPFLALMLIIQQSCKQRDILSKHSTKNISNCILLGYDSAAYYYGGSDNMAELKRGKLHDDAFISYILGSIKNHHADPGFKVACKPSAAGDVGQGILMLIDVFNLNNIQNRYIDSLDDKEQIFFNRANMPAVIAKIKGETFKLNLPGDGGTPETIIPGEHDITMLLLGNKNIYAYKGKDIRRGSKYTYNTIDQYLQNERKAGNPDFVVIIKANDESSYKDLVNALDKMKTNNITKYTLADMTKDEEAFTETLK